MGTFIAIFIPEGVEAPDRSIIKEPELQVYVANFGDKKMMYALWLRQIRAS